MKNLQNILLENIFRYNVKNLSLRDIQRLKLLEQETKEQSLTKRINFPSGMHSAQRGNVAGILGPELKSMQDFLVANKGSIVQIILSSSESLVTNYDGEAPNPKQAPLKPGQLSQMRYKTIETYMSQWLQGLLQQGIITAMPEIKQVPSQFGTTPYKAGVDNPRDPKYTAEQWLEVTLKVIAPNDDLDIIPIPEFEKAKTSTNRNPEATWNKYNSQALFYFRSKAAAAVLNKDAVSMPGALLTMNNIFELRVPIQLKNFNLPKFRMTITPNGGTEVSVLIMPKGIKTGTPDTRDLQDSIDSAEIYTARVADSYSLTPPFKPGTPEFKNAWIFAYWYIINSYPDDWNYISNKPTDINFDQLKNKLSSTGENKVFETSITLQDAWWKKYNAYWYAARVKDLTSE